MPAYSDRMRAAYERVIVDVITDRPIVAGSINPYIAQSVPRGIYSVDNGIVNIDERITEQAMSCLLYTSPSPRDPE